MFTALYLYRVSHGQGHAHGYSLFLGYGSRLEYSPFPLALSYRAVMDPHLNIIYHCHHESSLCDHICRDPNPCHLSLSSLPTGQCRAEGKVYSIQDCGQVCHDNPCPPPLPKWLLSGQSEQTLDYNWGQTEEAHREVIHNECTIINGWLSLYKCISHSFMVDIPYTSAFPTHLWLTFLIQVHSHLWLKFLIQVYFSLIYGWHSLYKCILIYGWHS